MKRTLGVSLFIVVIAALLAACGGGTAATTSQTAPTSTTASSTTSSAAPTTSTPGAPTSSTPVTSSTTLTSSTPATSSTPTTSQPSTTAASGSSYADVFGKVAGISQFYCEATITTTGQPTQNMKEWFKIGNPTKYRMEFTAGGTTFVIIYDGTNFYMYYPDENYAMQMSAAQADLYSSNSGDGSAAEQYSPVLVGSETVNGVDCYKYQYTAAGVTTYIWLSKANGMTIRIMSGDTTMDYTNYSFDAIPDSQFTLPSGVTMYTMPMM